MINRRPNRAGAVIRALVVAVIVGGCGAGPSKVAGTTSGQPAPGTPPPAAQAAAGAPGTGSGNGSGTDASACQLLSAADVTTAMGRPMKVSGGAGSAVCAYSATTDASVVLAVQTFATRADMATYTQIEPSGDHIDALGDDAFWNSTLDLVFVRKGDRAFVVTSPSLANLVSDPQGSRSAMTALAKIVLGKF